MPEGSYNKDKLGFPNKESDCPSRHETRPVGQRTFDYCNSYFLRVFIASATSRPYLYEHGNGIIRVSMNSAIMTSTLEFILLFMFVSG